MELEFIKDDVGYIRDAVNIGVIKKGQDVILVDTGLDKGTARGIRMAVEGRGLTIKAVINTHSHADHFGGNDYLVRNLNVKVYASEIESGIIQNPILEPVYLFNGAFPIDELRNKFVLADPSPVHHIIHPGSIMVHDVELDIVALPGHSFNQVGVLYEDVFFCADSIFDERVIQKYKIPVVQDVRSQIKTLNYLKNTSYGLYVPSHTSPIKDVSKLVENNSNLVDKITKDLLKLLNEPLSTDEVLSKICNSYKLSLTRVQQYYLIRMTLMAYLGYLKEKNRLHVSVEKNELKWRN